MKHIQTLKELKKDNDTQYKSRSMYIDYINTQHENGLEKQEIYQIWSYSTVIGYFNKTTNKIVFTNRKYSTTTSKQKTQLLNENRLEKQEINETFANWTTYTDLQKIKSYLI